MSKYPSKYSPGKKVTPAQYITEIVCERRASSLKTNLPVYFWRLDGWKQYYLFQIKIANELLNTYSENAIINSLNDDACKTVFSLRNPILLKKIKSYKEKKIDTREREREIIVDSTGINKKKKNILDKLNGKEND
jgi:hypothetical protein